MHDISVALILARRSTQRPEIRLQSDPMPPRPRAGGLAREVLMDVKPCVDYEQPSSLKEGKYVTDDETGIHDVSVRFLARDNRVV